MAKRKSKLADKINELNSDIVLLNKVGRKISRSSRIQRGGADPVELKQLQKDALIKRLQIEEQNAALTNAISQAGELTSRIGEINNALKQIESDIKGITVNSQTFAGVQVPNVATHIAKMLEAIGKFDLSVMLKDQADGVISLDLDQSKVVGKKYDGTDYMSLMSRILSNVYSLSITTNDIIQLRANLKIGNTWDNIVEITSSGQKAVVSVDDKKFNVSQKVYERLQTANPPAQFSTVSSSSSGSSAAAADATVAPAPVPLSGTPSSGSTRTPSASSSDKKYFW
jgi:hypothetical protein